MDILTSTNTSDIIALIAIVLFAVVVIVWMALSIIKNIAEMTGNAAWVQPVNRIQSNIKAGYDFLPLSDGEWVEQYVQQRIAEAKLTPDPKDDERWELVLKRLDDMQERLDQQAPLA